jgi:hypothetical protein
MKSTSQQTYVDFNLHNLVGIRLYNASPADVNAVERQLGHIQAAFVGNPDISIQFVEHLPHPSNLRFLGVDEAAFDADGFYVLRAKHKIRTEVKIPFEEIGKPCTLVCQTGLPAVPLLIPIINLTAIAKGALPLHASAFMYNQLGSLITGWSKGGKTETLLAFMRHGAGYIGDEWVYISPDGRTISGIPEPIRLWDWHLQQLPEFADTVGQRNLMRLRLTKAAGAADDRMAAGVKRYFPPAKMLSRAAPLLKRQLFVDVQPTKLFGQSAIAMSGSLDRIFFTTSEDTDRISVERINPVEIAQRMVFSLQYERLNLYSFYMMFRFAFPEKSNSIIENAETMQRDLLIRLLQGKEAYIVRHPYPFSIAALYEAMRPYISFNR